MVGGWWSVVDSGDWWLVVDEIDQQNLTAWPYDIIPKKPCTEEMAATACGRSWGVGGGR